MPQQFDVSRFRLEPIFEETDREEISRLERKLGVTFPPDYVAFLLSHNRVMFRDDVAYPVIEQYSPAPDDETETVAILYGVGPKTAFRSIRWAMTDRDFEERVPAGIIPIGDNGFGNVLCVSTRPERYGQIYMWSPGLDWEDDENIPTDEYLLLVSTDFTAFLDSLFVVPNDD